MDNEAFLAYSTDVAQNENTKGFGLLLEFFVGSSDFENSSRAVKRKSKCFQNSTCYFSEETIELQFRLLVILTYIKMDYHYYQKHLQIRGVKSMESNT